MGSSRVWALQRHGFTWAAAGCGSPPEAWVHMGSSRVCMGPLQRHGFTWAAAGCAWVPSRGMGFTWAAAGCGSSPEACGFSWAAAGCGFPPEAWVHMGSSRVWDPSRGMGSHGQQQSVGPLQRHGFTWAAVGCGTPPEAWVHMGSSRVWAWVHMGSNRVWVLSRGMGSQGKQQGVGPLQRHGFT